MGGGRLKNADPAPTDQSIGIDRSVCSAIKLSWSEKHLTNEREMFKEVRIELETLMENGLTYNVDPGRSRTPLQLK